MITIEGEIEAIERGTNKSSNPTEIDQNFYFSVNVRDHYGILHKMLVRGPKAHKFLADGINSGIFPSKEDYHKKKVYDLEGQKHYISWESSGEWKTDRYDDGAKRYWANKWIIG